MKEGDALSEAGGSAGTHTASPTKASVSCHSQGRQAETKSLTTLRFGLAQEGKERTNEVCMQGSNWDKQHPGNEDIEEKGQVQRHFLMSTTTELGHSLEVR